jgi:hypothetical protein
MLSAKAVFEEILDNDEAFHLFCSLAASDEAQGGCENGRIAALVPESYQDLAPKIARHGADEDKHGRIFNALLRRRAWSPCRARRDRLHRAARGSGPGPGPLPAPARQEADRERHLHVPGAKGSGGWGEEFARLCPLLARGSRARILGQARKPQGPGPSRARPCCRAASRVSPGLLIRPATRPILRA